MTPLLVAQPRNQRSVAMAVKIHTGTSLVIRESNGTYRAASSDEILDAARSAIFSTFDVRLILVEAP